MLLLKARKLFIMIINETEIETELELEQWLKEHCYSMISYSIYGNLI